MNWDAIGAIGEIIGASAVVGTLFYLLIQVRQSQQVIEANTKAIRGNAAWDAEIAFAQRNFELAHSAEHADLIQRSYVENASITQFSDSERVRVVADTASTLQTIQAQYFLWREGSLPNEIWAYRSKWARRYIMLPVIQAIWDDLKSEDFFSKEFVDLIEAIPPSKSASLSIATLSS